MEISRRSGSRSVIPDRGHLKKLAPLSGTGRIGDLDISEHLRRQWVVERAGWVLMVLIACAALAGLFGGDVLATGLLGGCRGDLAV